MRLTPSDPDIETIVGRIKRNEINLRPDFQRGEVWSDAKRRRLIDSILRQWHVPPIHLIALEQSDEREVLDGQQRLAAIRDFSLGKFTIDGHIQPPHPEIEQLHGLSYLALSPQWKRRFNQFTLRVFTVTDYQPDEPYELFFRLNQPTTLTSAEQRNAFYGPAREQIKRLVNVAQQCGLTRASIGFSNARMAYDEVLARACEFSEAGSFWVKITASTLTNRYRSKSMFSSSAELQTETALRLLGLGLASSGKPVRLNKATLLSWLLFCGSNKDLSGDGDFFGEFLMMFEDLRAAALHHPSDLHPLMRQLLEAYEGRASSSVNESLSVAIRDFVLWAFFAHWSKRPQREARCEIARQITAALRGQDDGASRGEIEFLLEGHLILKEWSLR